MQCAGRHDQEPEMRKGGPQRSPKQQTQKLQHKAAIKREQSDARINSAERKQTRPKGQTQKRKETNYART